MHHDSARDVRHDQDDGVRPYVHVHAPSSRRNRALAMNQPCLPCRCAGSVVSRTQCQLYTRTRLLLLTRSHFSSFQQSNTQSNTSSIPQSTFKETFINHLSSSYSSTLPRNVHPKSQHQRLAGYISSHRSSASSKKSLP